MKKIIITTEIYLKNILNKFGHKYYDKFLFNKTEYKKSNEKIIITCKVHGDFFITAGNFLYGKNCKKCARLKTAEKRSLSWEYCLEKANKTHNNKYIYTTKPEKFKARDVVSIYCPEHKIYFIAQMWQHMNKTKCPRCAKNGIKDKTSFIEDLVKRFGSKILEKYNFDKTEYINSTTPIIVICKNHKKDIEFTISPNKLYSGRECPHCNINISKIEIRWLNMVGVPEYQRNKTLKINGKTFKVDAFNDEKNIIYEFNGDYWHSNPIIYTDPNKMHPILNKTHGENYQNTIDREQLLKEAGFTVISIWENDFNKIIASLEYTQQSPK